MQAFAVPRALPLRPSRAASVSCSRRPPARPHTTTPYATRATLTPDSTPTPAVQSDFKPTQSAPQSIEAVSPSDQPRIQAVRKQMEFWFSASNLRRDWYLRRQMDDDGWLDPATFLRFNRIKSLHASLQDIILACSLSDELEVSIPESSFGDTEGQTRVRRSPTLPDFREWDDDELARSFILKRIPADSTIVSLQAIFEPFASASYIRVYRSKEPESAARALICFDDVKTADTIFAEFPTGAPPEAKGIVMRRRNVSPTGAEEAVAGQPAATPKPALLILKMTNVPTTLDWRSVHGELSDLLLHRTGLPLRYLLYTQGEAECYITVADNPAVRTLLTELSQDGVQIAQSQCAIRLLENPEEVRQYWVVANEYQERRKARRAEKEAQTEYTADDSKPRHPQGVIVRMEGFQKDTSWHKIKQDLQQMGRLVYLTYDRRTRVSYARFGSALEARSVSDLLSSGTGPSVSGSSVSAYVLYGEEEEEYWKRAEESRRAKANREKDDSEKEAGDS